MNAVSIDIGGILDAVNEHRDEIDPGFDREDLVGLDLPGQAQGGKAIRRPTIVGLTGGQSAAHVVRLQAEEKTETVREKSVR